MTEEEFALLAAGAALGALSDADERTFRRALTAHPEWASVVDDDARTVAALAELVDEVTPPAAMRGRILDRIDADPAGGPALDSIDDAHALEADPHPAGAVRRPTHRRRTWFVLAACLVLLAGIGVGTVFATQHAARPAYVIALDRIEAAPDAQQATADVQGGGAATLHWSATAGQAVLVTSTLPELTESQTFELWYVRGTTPISAGTFGSSGRTTTVLLHAGMKPGDIVAVTVERAGGSPDGRPTTTPILTIPTA